MALAPHVLARHQALVWKVAPDLKLGVVVGLVPLAVAAAHARVANLVGRDTVRSVLHLRLASRGSSVTGSSRAAPHVRAKYADSPASFTTSQRFVPLQLVTVTMSPSFAKPGAPAPTMRSLSPGLVLLKSIIAFLLRRRDRYRDHICIGAELAQRFDRAFASLIAPLHDFP